MKTLKNILLGMYLLLQSPSGVFALISLVCVTYVTIKQPAVGGVAFAAFFPVVITLLAYCEHKETLANMALSNTTPSQQTNIIVDPNLPAKGQ